MRFTYAPRFLKRHAAKVVSWSLWIEKTSRLAGWIDDERPILVMCGKDAIALRPRL